ncbi:MAG: T9SS C-terminal target domain-containing protein, partial [Bacteroidetes bacterium]
MNNISRALVIVLISVFVTSQSFAEKYRYENGKKQGSGLKETSAGCAPASAYDWLDINNVRARINTGGDMWWDLDGTAKYFVPKAGSATSMFSGALWIGGLDINNQLKLAAQRYRQVGIDYWTGPLTIDGTAATDEATCARYDGFAKVTRAAVDDFLSHTDPETGFFVPSEDYEIPPEILEWPAHGDVTKNQSYYLAPFYDNDGDGEYDPFAGDYPYYDIENVLCHTDIASMEEELEGTITGSILADQVIKGDQTLWWVFNDKGNVHTETNGAAIGMEIRAQAFAFATNDEINNMTFYSYEIINRSTFVLTQTFFSPWVDTDLGYARDDFVGCDVARGLGYCYNGTAIDGSGDPESYGGPQPPPP